MLSATKIDHFTCCNAQRRTVVPCPSILPNMETLILHMEILNRLNPSHNFDVLRL